MKTGVIIQARTSSTRLPKKVLKYLPYNSDITVLEQVIRRVKKSSEINDIIIATTEDKGDDEIVQIAEKERVNWFRGSKQDVLERYYLSAKQYNVDIIVRITSDCPCIDPGIIDMVIDEHIKTDSDYTTNALFTSFPYGLDLEVLNYPVLEKAHIEATRDFEREHVCPYIYRTKPDLFKITNIKAPQNLNVPDIRITLDTEEDYALLCAVFDYLYYQNNYFNTQDIVNLFKEKSWLKIINRKIMQKKVFDTFTDELAEAIQLLALQELNNVKKFLENHLKNI